MDIVQNLYINDLKIPIKKQRLKIRRVKVLKLFNYTI